MSKSVESVKRTIKDLEKAKSIEALSKQLVPKTKKQLDALGDPKFDKSSTDDGLSNRRKFIKSQGHEMNHVYGEKFLSSAEELKGNIENFIGVTQIPIGLAGPLLVNGTSAQGDFFVPLATTEGALVASYNRGMKACRLAGGIASVCLSEGVQRSPYFKFDSIISVGAFIKWVHIKFETFASIVSKTSRYAVLTELKTTVEGNSVILTFEYSTGDAAGQNMVTICTYEVCKYILEGFEIKPLEWYIESNYSGDKKATTLSFSNVRGKKVTAEITLSRAIVTEVLKSDPLKIANYWRASTLAVIQSGSIGAQGHVANGLTALFIACGQDVACISESSVGITRMEVTPEDDLYVALTLPSLIVGTLGGGTGLPTQMECLELLDCKGEGKARKFAEICCAVALAGEISIASAMAADHFTRSHQQLGRKSNE